MNTVKLFLIWGILLLSAEGYLYGEEGSDVLIFGPGRQKAEDSQEYLESEEDVSETFSPEPEIKEDLISGIRIADVVVSEAVTIKEPWKISYVNSPMGVGFALIRVDKKDRETLVYEVDSPIRVTDKRFAAGRYKVYPYSAGGPEMGEISVSIHCSSRIRKED